MKINKRRPAFEYRLINDTEDLFVTIFDITPVAIVILSWPSKQILKANSAAFSLLKVKTVEAIASKYPNLFNRFSSENFGSRDSFEAELKIRNSAGSFIYLLAKARKFEDDKLVVSLEDITQHKKKEKKLLKLAQIDGLTGLLNHKTLMQRFKQEFSRAKRYHFPLSCIMLDVDNFKIINDELGHLKGDDLLKKVAQTLKNNLRETDIVGRYGGDEFLIILPETPMTEVGIPANRIRASFSETSFFLKNTGKQINASLSIGITGFPSNGVGTVKDLIMRVDKGLYESKLQGGNNISFFTT